MINDKTEGRSTGIDENNNLFKNVQYQPDAYIFCTSTEKMDLSDKSFDEGYDSCYCIINEDKFATLLKDLVRAQLTLEHISPISLERIKPHYTRLGLSQNQFFNEIVIELHQKKVIYNKGDIVRIGNMFNVKDQFQIATFYKPPKYAKQKEYRMAFALYHPRLNMTMDVSENPLLLKSENLLDYVRKA